MSSSSAINDDKCSSCQLLTMGERAIRTAIAKTVWARCVERLPPNEKITFAHVVDEWARMLTRRLDELQREAA